MREKYLPRYTRQCQESTSRQDGPMRDSDHQRESFPATQLSDASVGGLHWTVNADHYEAMLDDWLESTHLRGKQWTGMSDDSPPSRAAGSSLRLDVHSVVPDAPTGKRNSER